MELALANGEYEVSNGALRVVTGEEEILQRVVYRLKARRGGFAPLPEVGSRLYTLPRLPKGQRQSAAKQYVREALTGEEEIRLNTVEVTEQAGVLYITVALRYATGSAVVTVEI